MKDMRFDVRVTALHILLVPFFAFGQSNQETSDIVSLIEEANRRCTSKQEVCTSIRPRPRPTSLTAPSGDGAVAEKPAEVGGSALMASASGLQTERTKIKDLYGRELEIDVIPEDQIRRLRNLLPSNLRPFDDEVCSQRAHTIGDTLAKQGIETVKLVLKPEWSLLWTNYIIPDAKARSSRGRTPRWDYHVVNMIYVRKANGQLEEYIIDPFMESYPVPRSHWESRLRSNPKSSIGSMDVASRYVMDDRDLSRRELSYDERVLQRSYAIMRGEPKH